MRLKSFKHSEQGASHIKRKKDCQDSSRSWHSEDGDMAVAVVCDGHGGDDYIRSREGAMFAVDVAMKEIKDFLNTVSHNPKIKAQFMSKPEMWLKDLEKSVISEWYDKIGKDREAKPFDEQDLKGISEKARKRYTEEKNIEEGKFASAYGTTMIAVAVTRDFWFGIQIGDGKCVTVDADGNFFQPIPPNPKCFLNATTSICDSDAIENFEEYFDDKIPAAVFIGSDGVDDCFKNEEQLYNLYAAVLYSFGTSPYEEALDGLVAYMPTLSEKGSGDDLSIAAVYDEELLPELDIVKNYDREKEKAKVEENVRREKEKEERDKKTYEEQQEVLRCERCWNCEQEVNKSKQLLSGCENQPINNKSGRFYCNNPIKKNLLAGQQV